MTTYNVPEFSKLAVLVKKEFDLLNSKSIHEFNTPKFNYTVPSEKAIHVSRVKDNSYYRYNVYFHGVKNPKQTVIISRSEFKEELAHIINKNIYLSGITIPSHYKLSEIAIFKLAIAMISTGKSLEKILLGLGKGYCIYIQSLKLESLNGKTYIEFCLFNIPSVSPLGEESIFFTSKTVLSDSEFGQNVVNSQGRLGRLCFEAANKLVARENKLGANKIEDKFSIGKRTIYLIDRALNNGSLPSEIEKVLVLGTIWVSSPEYVKLGSVRCVPTKGVTAPLPLSAGNLNEGEFLIGGNTHKSSLNGLCSIILGMSHIDISSLNEEAVRALLKPYEVSFELMGHNIKCYRYDMEIFATNFYSLYGIKTPKDSSPSAIMDEDYSFDSEFDSEYFSGIKSFYLNAINLIKETAINGGIFNLNDYIIQGFNEGIVVPKRRITTLTSAEYQQLGVSYDKKVYMSYIDSLLRTDGINYKSKTFLRESASDLPIVSYRELLNVFNRNIKGDIEPTFIPEGLYYDLYNLLGSYTNGFSIQYESYLFPFFSLRKLEIKDGYVNEQSDTLSSLMLMGATLRNVNKADFDIKKLNHMFDINSSSISKVQETKVNGAYLAAVTGYWLGDSQVFSIGDKVGRVTAAKLPVLFDKSVSSLENVDSNNTPYCFDEIELYQYHFSKIGFVSPAFFLSQENDGDGDLIKITKGHKAIPYWTKQPFYTSKLVLDYTAGEYKGLTLKFKPYSFMELTGFGYGSFAAADAKANVGILSSNAYKVKEEMIPFIQNNPLDSKEYFVARIIAEAASYLVQYGAMRSIKQSNGSSFSIVSLVCKKRDSKELPAFIDSWKSLIVSLFDIEFDSSEDSIFCDYIRRLFYTQYNYAKINAKTYLMNADSGYSFNLTSFTLMQKSFMRSLKEFSSCVYPKMNSVLKVSLLNCLDSSQFFPIYSKYVSKAFSDIINDTDDSKFYSPFEYFIKCVYRSNKLDSFIIDAFKDKSVSNISLYSKDIKSQIVKLVSLLLSKNCSNEEIIKIVFSLSSLYDSGDFSVFEKHCVLLLSNRISVNSLLSNSDTINNINNIDSSIESNNDTYDISIPSLISINSSISNFTFRDSNSSVKLLSGDLPCDTSKDYLTDAELRALRYDSKRASFLYALEADSKRFKKSSGFNSNSKNPLK